MNADDKTETQTKTRVREWWEVEGLDDLPEDDREQIRNDAARVESQRGQSFRAIFQNAQQGLEDLKREAHTATLRYRVIRRYFEAARQFCNDAPAARDIRTDCGDAELRSAPPADG